MPSQQQAAVSAFHSQSVGCFFVDLMANFPAKSSEDKISAHRISDPIYHSVSNNAAQAFADPQAKKRMQTPKTSP